MSMIERKDADLDFGTFTLASSTVFENVLDLGESEADHFGVNFAITTAAAGGTSWTPKLQGSSDGSTWADLVVGAAQTSTAAGEGITLYFPRESGVRYVRPNITKSGTYTAGVVSAAVDAYRA